MRHLATGIRQHFHGNLDIVGVILHGVDLLDHLLVIRCHRVIDFFTSVSLILVVDPGP